MLLGEKTWLEARDLARAVVVVPLGSHEQHGHHLPLLTDSFIGEEIVRRAASQAGEAVFLPMLWLGCSPHHLEFNGTVSVSSETYIRIIEDVAESLIQSGFRRILFFNSHAGNITPTSTALARVQLRHATPHPDLWLLFTSWFDLIKPVQQELSGLIQTKISHACEWETSQIMVSQPKMVKDERPAGRFSMDVNGQPSRFFHPDHTVATGVEVARRIDQGSSSGAFGWPEMASVEKGEQLYQLASRELCALLQEFASWPDRLEPGMTSGKAE